MLNLKEGSNGCSGFARGLVTARADSAAMKAQPQALECRTHNGFTCKRYCCLAVKATYTRYKKHGGSHEEAQI